MTKEKGQTPQQTIVKNTAFLYVRMLAVMAVTFYTSRVVLQSLGETNYGIYDVVGGVVVMMSFLNNSLAGSTSRFLTYALGCNDLPTLKQTFSAALNLHIMVAVFVVLVGETVGLCFLYNKMTIPADRMDAAFWVYQFSIVTTCFTFTQVPYNASIISHENMAVFAYIGLYEAFSKLAIAFIISWSSCDRLMLYGLLLMANSVMIQIFYRLYTLRHYEECRMGFVRDKGLYRKLLSYSGWDLFGQTAVIFQGQGLNILLNIFFGPIMNTARAIAVQIQTGLKLFVNNFLMAVRPRVVKLFAEEDYGGMYTLTFYAAKISYFLMLGLILPLAFEMDFILHIWLGNEVPDYTKVFAWIILTIALADTFHAAYLMTFHAIGRVKTGNVVCGTLMMLTLPVGYGILKMGLPPYSVFLVVLVINVVCHIISWAIVHGYIAFDVVRLVKVVYLPAVKVTVFSFIVPYLISRAMADGWGRFFVLSCSTEIVYLILCYRLGFSAHEREIIIMPIVKKIVGVVKS